MTEGDRRFLIIHNPTAGSRNANRLSKILKLLEEENCQITLAGTQYAGHATEIAAEAVAVKENWSAIVAAGGDGTICEVANGMRDTDIPLGIIPLGTANVLARELEIGTTSRRVVSVLTSVPPIRIFPGLMGRKRFMLMVGAGYDSLAVAELNPLEKKKYGAFAYILAALRAVKRFNGLRVRVTTDGQSYEGASVIVSRSRLYGGPFTLVPDADLRQPGLHIVLLKNTGIWAALKYGAALATNRIWKLSSVDYIKAEGEVTVVMAPEFLCQCDGDRGPETPVTLSTDPGGLHVLSGKVSKV
ncbi:MAG: diacylglycerol kinase family protein [Sneathiella sp.]